MDLVDFCKISFKIVIGLCLFLAFADCGYVANNTFTVAGNTPQGQGRWKAVATCNTNIHSISYAPNGAWMVSRFGVPILSYKDYLGGNSFEIGPDNKWVISIIGYGGGGSTLTFGLEFEYDVWMGSENPTGDCYQFTVYQEAKDFAETVDLLNDTPADTLIATADFSLLSTSHTGSLGQCQFSYPGIKFGEKEGLILVNFHVPVTYQTDFIGNTVLDTADDHTWYIVEIAYGQEHSTEYNVNFNFETSDHDVSKATCYLYVSLDDAVTASSQLGATTPPQTTTGAAHWGSSSMPTTLTAPLVTVTPAGWTPAVVPHVPRSNKNSGNLYESRDMRNKYVQNNNLWTRQLKSALHCGRQCLADERCISVFYHETSSECTAHNSVYGSGVTKSGTSYYVVQP